MNLNESRNMNKSFTNLIDKKNTNKNKENTKASLMNQKKDLAEKASSNYKTFTNLYSAKINHAIKYQS